MQIDHADNAALKRIQNLPNTPSDIGKIIAEANKQLEAWRNR